MTGSPEPTRFFHTPGIGTTTYLIANTPDGHALAAATPEDSTWLRIQRRLERAIKPLALLTLAAMGFVAGDFLISPFITSGPLLGVWGIAVVVVIAAAMIAAYVFSTTGHTEQRNALASQRDLAQPTRFTPASIADLPMTIRGVATLTVLSRAADAKRLGAIYTELDYPYRTHPVGIEDVVVDLTRQGPPQVYNPALYE